MILDCSNKSVINFSIEGEITTKAIRYKNGDSPYLRKQEQLILLYSTDQLINNYNIVFYRFIEHNDVTILYRNGTVILKCIIIKVIAIMFDRTKEDIWETREEIMNRVGTIFQVDKTLNFEGWIDNYYSTIFNEEIYEILKLQIFILNLIIDNQRIQRLYLDQYIKMYIKISLKSKMLELLLPINKILKSIGRVDILLAEYYHRNTTIPSPSPTTLPSSLPMTSENLMISSPWYKRLYNWMISTIQKIRSFIIKH